MRWGRAAVSLPRETALGLNTYVPGSLGAHHHRRAGDLSQEGRARIIGRRLGGVVLTAVTALFVVQLGRRIGWDNLSADNIDVGPYLAGAGGLLALFAPTGLWPFRRRRPQPPT